MNRPRILLVEDEENLRRVLSDRLTVEGYDVTTAADGIAATRLALATAFDAIILDLNLPLRDGLTVCDTLRQHGVTSAILMLTARDTVEDTIIGLKRGADDYMTKPFESAELLARIEAMLRRTTPAAAADSYVFANVEVRPRAGLVLKNGAPVRVSPQEFKLLCHFVRNPGVLLSRDTLLDAVWGYDATPETRTVDVHIGWLRQKLEPDPHAPKFFVTVFGLGYRFEGPELPPRQSTFTSS